MESLIKKVWIKPEIKSLSIKQNTFSGPENSNKENPAKHIKIQGAS